MLMPCLAISMHCFTTRAIINHTIFWRAKKSLDSKSRFLRDFYGFSKDYTSGVLSTSTLMSGKWFTSPKKITGEKFSWVKHVCLKTILSF